MKTEKIDSLVQGDSGLYLKWLRVFIPALDVLCSIPFPPPFPPITLV